MIFVSPTPAATLNLNMDKALEHSMGTALSIFAAKNDVKNVLYLLNQKDVDVNKTLAKNGGRTAIIGAASFGCLESVELLIAHGADPLIVDNVVGSDAVGHAELFTPDHVKTKIIEAMLA